MKELSKEESAFLCPGGRPSPVGMITSFWSARVVWSACAGAPWLTVTSTCWQRAERRAGEMLSEMELGPGNPQWSHDVTNGQPKLSDFGISKMQSHRWQLEASIDDIYRAMAKENQRLSKGRGLKGLQNSANLLDTREELAKIAHVSHDTVG